MILDKGAICLATGGQPSEPQLRELAERGFEVIINVGLLDQAYSLAEEAGLGRSLGMAYYHIPVDFGAPAVEDFDRFLQVMAWPQGGSHCAANVRVSSFVSLYGHARLSWSLERAQDLVDEAWEPDGVWAQFIANSRKALVISHSAHDGLR